MVTSNGTTRRKPTYDHLKKAKQPSIQKLKMIMDAEADIEFKEASRVYQLAKLLYGERAEIGETAAVRELDEAKTRYDAALVAAEEHSVDAQQIEKAGDKEEEKPDWNVDTFPQALVAAACISPELTSEQTAEMWEDDAWSEADLNELFRAAIQVQNTRRLLEVGNV
jgi:hypothetical protein